MKYDQKVHLCQSISLKNYDYSRRGSILLLFVRNEDEYINNNPINWDKDKLNKDVVNQIIESSPNYGNERREKIELHEE